MSFGPYIAAAAFGLLKGLTSGPGDDEHTFTLEHNFVGPIKEELLYRGAPLWAAPGLPMGSTAAVFAVDHVMHDARLHSLAGTSMTPMQVIARLGDVFLGGMLYELSYRRSGLAGAIGSHLAHNAAVVLGSKVRR